MTPLPTSTPSGPILRLFDPADDDELPSRQRKSRDDGTEQLGRLTMRQAYEQHLLPTLLADKKSPGTIQAYENALGHWERVMEANPPLDQLDDDQMDAFRNEAEGEYEATTCNKWFRHLRAIMNRMGPRIGHKKLTRRNRGYFQDVPYLEDLPEQEPDPVEMTEAQINAVYAAATNATWPPPARTGCEPGTWWQVSIVYMLNIGPRRHDWLWLSRSNFDLHKGKFWYKAKKTKKRHDLVFNDAILSHFALLPAGPDLLFAPSKGHKQLYAQWHKIQAIAGIKRPDGEPFEFRDLRETAAARYHDHAPGTAQLLLGHTLQGGAKLTAERYIGEALLKPLWAAIKSVPQPAAFLPVINEWKETQARKKAESKHFDPNQRKLFD